MSEKYSTSIPRVWKRAILLCAHTTIYRFYSVRPARKEEDPWLRRPVDRVSHSDSRGKPCLASTAAYIRRVYIPFKNLISRRGWIKIRTSSFVESKCIIVRFRAKAGPPVERRETRARQGRCRCSRESHWRVVVQPRPLDVKTSVPTTRIERTLGSFERLSRERDAARRVGCMRHKIRVPSRDARFSPSNADVKRDLLHPPGKGDPGILFRFRGAVGFFVRSSRALKNKSPAPRLLLEVKDVALRHCIGLSLAFRPARFSFSCIFYKLPWGNIPSIRRSFVAWSLVSLLNSGAREYNFLLY